MKKSLVLLIFLSLVLVIALGCSSGTSSPAPSSTTSSSPAINSTSSTTSNPTSTPTITSTTTSTPAATSKYGGTLTIAYSVSPGGNIGWPVELIGDGSLPPQIFFDPLLRYTDTGDLIPCLAESYKVSADNNSVVFNLRKGVKFHDGTDFNAQAAKWNMDQEIAAKKVPNWLSVDVIDDYTIKVNLKQYRNSSMSDFADVNYSYMVSPTAFEKNGIDWIRQNPVGTGPFKFVSFDKDVALKSVRNPDYWMKDDQGNQLPYLDALNFNFVADSMTQLAVMKSGGADIADTETGKRAADMAAALLVVKATTTGTTALFPDSAHPDSPFANQEVREAVAYSIDRDAIAKGLGYGYWEPAYQIPAPGSNVYDPNFNLGLRYDPDKAKQLLADAGYAKGFKMTLISAPAGRNKDVCTALQGYLAKVGITADIEYPDQPKYISYQTGEWQNAMLIQGLPSYPNMNTYLEVWLSTSSPRFKSWARSDEFNRLVAISSSAPSMDKSLITAALDELVKETAIIPVHYSGRCWALQPYVMDTGFFERSAPSYFNSEHIWLNK
jgi:peptide/nickel transport system substrate-binding protein